MPTIDDGMPLAERLEALRGADANADLSRRVMLWRAVVAHLRSELAGCKFQAPQKCLRLIKVYAINFIP
jgi:hypothetical protein